MGNIDLCSYWSELLSQWTSLPYQPPFSSVQFYLYIFTTLHLKVLYIIFAQFLQRASQRWQCQGNKLPSRKNPWEEPESTEEPNLHGQAVEVKLTKSWFIQTELLKQLKLRCKCKEIQILMSEQGDNGDSSNVRMSCVAVQASEAGGQAGRKISQVVGASQDAWQEKYHGILISESPGSKFQEG